MAPRGIAGVSDLADQPLPAETLQELAALAREGVLAGLLRQPPVAARRLTGHASSRRFYRLAWRDGSTAVAVVYPDGAGDGVRRYAGTAAWLRRAGVRVPRVLAVGTRALLVSDAGDRLLDAWPRAGGARRRCYRQAFAFLEAIRRHARREPLPPGPPGLDARRLRAELDYLERHAAAGEVAGRDDRSIWYARLVEAIAALPVVACHRDYHARNLLVREGRVWVVDFQDLMPGPLWYDHASLLWDNYCDVPREWQGELLAPVLAATCAHPPPRADAAVPAWPRGLSPGARQAFCLVGVQRSLKALGTFAYQVRVAGREEYRGCVARTLEHVRAAVGQLGWAGFAAALRPLEAALRAL